MKKMAATLEDRLRDYFERLEDDLFNQIAQRRLGAECDQKSEINIDVQEKKSTPESRNTHIRKSCESLYESWASIDQPEICKNRPSDSSGHRNETRTSVDGTSEDDRNIDDVGITEDDAALESTDCRARDSNKSNVSVSSPEIGSKRKIYDVGDSNPGVNVKSLKRSSSCVGLKNSKMTTSDVLSERSNDCTNSVLPQYEINGEITTETKLEPIIKSPLREYMNLQESLQRIVDDEGEPKPKTKVEPFVKSQRRKFMSSKARSRKIAVEQTKDSEMDTKDESKIMSLQVRLHRVPEKEKDLNTETKLDAVVKSPHRECKSLRVRKYSDLAERLLKIQRGVDSKPTVETKVKPFVKSPRRKFMSSKARSRKIAAEKAKDSKIETKVEPKIMSLQVRLHRIAEKEIDLKSETKVDAVFESPHGRFMRSQARSRNIAGKATNTQEGENEMLHEENVTTVEKKNVYSDDKNSSQCDDCFVDLIRSAERVKNYVTSKKKHKCSRCSKRFLSQSSLDYHSSIHDIDVEQEDSSVSDAKNNDRKSADSADEVDSSARYETEDSIKCNICEKMFVDKKRWKRHEKKCAFSQEDEKSDVSDTTDFKPEATIHGCDDDDNSIDCEGSAVDEPASKSYDTSPKSSSECSDLDKETATDHVSEKCRSQVLTRAKLLETLKRSPKESNHKDKRAYKETDHRNIKLVKCGYCDMKFKSSSDCTHHVIKAHGKGQVLCTICNKLFPNGILKKKHVWKEHGVDRKLRIVHEKHEKTKHKPEQKNEDKHEKNGRKEKQKTAAKNVSDTRTRKNRNVKINEKRRKNIRK
ncbi:uncharacterized protein LOC141908016 [Tubulanus polymorphus]|uniref:uncharacterized protein LOC141908016 n=1 Tax=Tubulanus polymorphus TaxID=672921 RepID=UPI003DA43B88